MSLVRVERDGDGPVARVVMNRPEARNALSVAMIDGLVSAFGNLAADDGVRAVVLAGDGKDFCAGADLSDVTMMEADHDFARSFDGLLEAMETHPSPVVAAVQGSALGAGCQIVVACDLAIAADEARLGIPSARLGLLINLENIERLLVAVGRKRAGEILYSARVVSGNDAVAWGLVNEAVPSAHLHERSMDWAKRIADLAPSRCEDRNEGWAR